MGGFWVGVVMGSKVLFALRRKASLALARMFAATLAMFDATVADPLAAAHMFDIDRCCTGKSFVALHKYRTGTLKESFAR